MYNHFNKSASALYSFDYFFPSINYNDDGTRIRIMFCIWLFGGLSLVFSTKINSKCLKAIVIVSNLICIFNWIIFGW
ncbi:predicted protein [Enterococcus faecium Com15]|nr:predicted protein [Enterococcus faecium Com15]